MTEGSISLPESTDTIKNADTATNSDTIKNADTATNSDTIKNADTATNATITVRLIKSFEFKNFRNVVFHSLDLTALNLADLEKLTRDRISASPLLARLFPAASPVPLDTFKRYYTRHSAKTNNAIINVGEDEKLVIFDFTKKLAELGMTHETEISWFNWDSYIKYCNDPTFKWE